MASAKRITPECRVIKFRAWSEHMKTMYEDVQIHSDDADTTNPWLFMQFTGLKDRNGKEIYEGDIVQDGDGNRAEVRWEAPEFVAMWADTPMSSWNLISLPSHGEVIGNVHESPELLKEAA